MYGIKLTSNFFSCIFLKAMVGTFCTTCLVTGFPFSQLEPAGNEIDGKLMFPESISLS